jgi:hypothetical protein
MGKKLFFYTAMAVFMLAMLVGFAFVAVHLVDQEDFFDHREGVRRLGIRIHIWEEIENE